MSVVVCSRGPEGALIDFFRQQMMRAARRLNPTPHEETSHYLVHMLNHFSQSDRLFEYQDGRLGLRPLALIYREAHEASTEHERCILLQRLGDLSLFLSALFPEIYARRGIRRDYFIGMGGGAYNYLAERAPNRRHVFGELTNRFVQMAELVARACQRSDDKLDANELLRLYSLWQETGNPALAAQLRAQGVQISRVRH